MTLDDPCYLILIQGPKSILLSPNIWCNYFMLLGPIHGPWNTKLLCTFISTKVWSENDVDLFSLKLAETSSSCVLLTKSLVDVLMI